MNPRRKDRFPWIGEKGKRMVFNLWGQFKEQISMQNSEYDRNVLVDMLLRCRPENTRANETDVTC